MALPFSRIGTCGPEIDVEVVVEDSGRMEEVLIKYRLRANEDARYVAWYIALKSSSSSASVTATVSAPVGFRFGTCVLFAVCSGIVGYISGSDRFVFLSLC